MQNGHECEVRAVNSHSVLVLPVYCSVSVADISWLAIPHHIQTKTMCLCKCCLRFHMLSKNDHKYYLLLNALISNLYRN